MTKEYHPDIYVDPESARQRDLRKTPQSVINPNHSGLPSTGYRESPRKVSLLDMGFDIFSDQ